MLKKLFRKYFPERPCNCHGCQPIIQHRSRNPNVSYGMTMWVKDGKIHWRQKSRINVSYPDY